VSDEDDPNRQMKGVGIMTLQTLVNTCIPVHTRVRTNVTLTINPQLVAKAHELGLNVSRISELALSKAITSLQQTLEVAASPDAQPSWARGLVRTRTLRMLLARKPAEPEIRGSNPRGPAKKRCPGRFSTVRTTGFGRFFCLNWFPNKGHHISLCDTHWIKVCGYT